MLKRVMPTTVDTFNDEKVWLPSIDNNLSQSSFVKRLIPFPSAPKTIAISSFPFLNEVIFSIEVSSSPIMVYPSFFNLAIVCAMFLACI